MKKIYLTLFVVVASLGFGFSQTCTVDTSNHEFIAPPEDQFPCAKRSVAYSESIQIEIPASYSVQGQSITIDSLIITGITGFPTGISYVCNPAGCAYSGGTQACINFYGTTTDTVGSYKLTFQGSAKVTVPILGAQTFSFATLASIPGAPSPGYRLDVINQGDSCRGPSVGIKSFNSALNSAMNIFPNPSTGVFELKLNAGSRVNGEIVVVDMTGRKVFAQPLDVMGMYSTAIDLSAYSKGIYTVQLRTAEGFASKNISIE